MGLSILSGSHRELVPRVIDALRSAGVAAPVVVGGIIPAGDAAWMKDHGVAAVYTPKDYDTGAIMEHIARIAIDGRHGGRTVASGGH